VRRRLPFALVLAVLLVADLVGKDAVFTALDGYEENPALWKTIDVIPGFFRLVVVRNTGATFGLGSGLGPILLALNAVAILVLVWVFWRCRPGQWLRATCLTLILAGAFGNLYDRIRFGWVRDFLDVYVGDHHWPPFNVADACIVVGVLVLAAILWRAPEAKKGE
jgi:signal peptidase II